MTKTNYSPDVDPSGRNARNTKRERGCLQQGYLEELELKRLVVVWHERHARSPASIERCAAADHNHWARHVLGISTFKGKEQRQYHHLQHAKVHQEPGRMEIKDASQVHCRSRATHRNTNLHSRWLAFKTSSRPKCPISSSTRLNIKGLGIHHALPP